MKYEEKTNRLLCEYFCCCPCIVDVAKAECCCCFVNFFHSTDCLPLLFPQFYILCLVQHTKRQTNVAPVYQRTDP